MNLSKTNLPLLKLHKTDRDSNTPRIQPQNITDLSSSYRESQKNEYTFQENSQNSKNSNNTNAKKMGINDKLSDQKSSFM